MNPPTRLNRVLLAVIGLVLLVAGAGALALGTGWLSAVPGLGIGPDTALAQADPVWPAWAPTVAAVAATAVGVLALVWLFAQLRLRRSGRPWRTDGALGSTTLRLSDAADAVADDVRGYPGVAAATAVLDGPRARPLLRLVVDLRSGAGTAALQERIAGHALPRLRAALELDGLPTELLLRPAADPGGRGALR